MAYLQNFASLILAATTNGSGPGPMMAESPFNDYTAGVVIYVLLAAVLVSILLIGAFLVINLGLMSKRPEDRVGGRTPSDVAILKNNVWPESPYEQHELPAEEEDFEEVQQPAASAPKKAA